MGYSFSQLHSYVYSIIALQELNIFYHYSPVYWNIGCLTVEATPDEEGSGANSVDYGEIAKAIYKMRKFGVNIKAPDINLSNFEFTPEAKDNEILYGLGGISGINNDIVSQILSNSPYTSFTDFYNKNAYKGSLVTKSKFIQLIKAGCFDEFEPDRRIVMRQYFILSTPNVTSLAMNNIGQIKAVRVPIPKSIIGPYNFRKYVCNKQFKYGSHPKFKSKTLYWLDQKALKYFENHCKSSMVEGVDYWFEDDRWIVVDKSLEKLLAPPIETLKDYINTPEFLDKFNKARAKQSMIESVDGLDVNRWSFQSCAFYSQEHELANVNLAKYSISHFSDLPEEPQFVERSFGKRSWKQFELSAICGTVIGRTDSHHLVTILTPDNEVVNVKMNDGAFAHYKAQLSTVNPDGTKTVIEKSWLERGSLLICCGYRRGTDEFVTKKYKASIFPSQLMKITNINGPDIEIQTERYSEEN